MWSDDSTAVSLSNDGALHLKAIATAAKKSSNRIFNCSEISLATPLGYGTYEWDVAGDASALGDADPNVVLGMFMYKNDTLELDVELARWGNKTPGAHNADFVNQPGAGAGNRMFWSLPARSMHTTYKIQWNATAVVWTAFATENRGSGSSSSDAAGAGGGEAGAGGGEAGAHGADWAAPQTPYASQVSTDKVPAADGMLVHLNLWMFQGRATAAANVIEVVFTDFRFSAAGESRGWL